MEYEDFGAKVKLISLVNYCCDCSNMSSDIDIFLSEKTFSWVVLCDMLKNVECVLFENVNVDTLVSNHYHNKWY